MNIKLKAGLTVIGFFSAMIGVMMGIISIPDMWIQKYGLIILEVAAVIGSLVFAYMVALDYYKGVEEIKKMDEQTKRKIEGQNSRIL